MGIKYNKANKVLVWMIFFSVFILSYYIRRSMMGSIADINIIYFFASLILLYLNRKYIDKICFFMISFISVWIIIIGYLSGNLSIISGIKVLLVIMFPMYIITLELRGKYWFDIITKFIKAYNYFIIILFVIGIIDPIINFRIMKTLGTVLVPELSGLIFANANVNMYRYTSVMGHALVTKELFIIFFLINSCYYYKCKKGLINNKVLTVISLIGVLLTSSKVGIVIIIISIIASTIVTTPVFSKKIKSLIITIAFFIITYYLGFFDILIKRLLNESLTTGRSEAWNIVQSFDFINIKFFTGYGNTLHNAMAILTDRTIAGAALEYPLRILALQYGLFITVSIVFVIAIYPIVKLARKKEYYFIFCFILLFIETNTYNGLILKPDNIIIYNLFIMILMCISNMKRESKQILEENLF